MSWTMHSHQKCPLIMFPCFPSGGSAYPKPKHQTLNPKAHKSCSCGSQCCIYMILLLIVVTTTIIMLNNINFLVILTIIIIVINNILIVSTHFSFCFVFLEGGLRSPPVCCKCLPSRLQGREELMCRGFKLQDGRV